MLEVDVLVALSVKEHQATTSLVHVQERKAGRERGRDRVRGQGRKGRWREGRKVGRGRQRNNSCICIAVWLLVRHRITLQPVGCALIIPFSQR